MNIPDHTMSLDNHEELAITMPSGRVFHVWLCDHDDHESIDVWMTDGKPVHRTSERTGAPERAPMGVFGMVNGIRVKLPETGHTEHNWPAVSTIVLMFDKDDACSFECDACGRIGNTDDGISGDGDECPDEDCPGTVHKLGVAS